MEGITLSVCNSRITRKDSSTISGNSAFTIIKVEADSKNSTEHENRCPISYDTFVDGKTTTTTCGHKFMSDSLQTWLLTKTPETRKCPTCRTKLFLNHKSYKDFEKSITCDSDAESVLEEINGSPLSIEKKQKLILKKVHEYIDNTINNVVYLRNIELLDSEISHQYYLLLNETTDNMSQYIYIHHSPFDIDEKNRLYLEKANTHSDLKGYLNLFNELPLSQKEKNEKTVEKLKDLTPDMFIDTIKTTNLIYLNPMNPELQEVESEIRNDILRLKADRSLSLEETTQFFNATSSDYQTRHPDYLAERESYFDSLIPPKGYCFANCLPRLCH